MGCILLQFDKLLTSTFTCWNSGCVVFEISKCQFALIYTVSHLLSSLYIVSWDIIYFPVTNSFLCGKSVNWSVLLFCVAECLFCHNPFCRRVLDSLAPKLNPMALSMSKKERTHLFSCYKSFLCGKSVNWSVLLFCVAEFLFCHNPFCRRESWILLLRSLSRWRSPCQRRKEKRTRMACSWEWDVSTHCFEMDHCYLGFKRALPQ